MADVLGAIYNDGYLIPAVLSGKPACVKLTFANVILRIANN